MNAVGTDDNVRTLIHEAGHALHVLERGRLRWVWQRRSPMEFSEVASMTMELLAYPNLDRRYGGPYDRIDAIRSQIGHLEGIIEFLPYMAVVDGFQEWVYSHPGHDQADRDQAWRVLHEQYCVSADWTGLEDSRASLWQHKQHIFVAPLYYVEYGLAQLGALQVWQASLADRPRALAAYRRALALGGTRCLPALYEEAGARLAFDPGPMREAIGLVERALDELYADLETARGASSLS
jgi:oligoendopeptidase F